MQAKGYQFTFQESEKTLRGDVHALDKQLRNNGLLIDFLLENLPAESNQRTMTLELRDLLERFSK